jgi:hypothetical protein
MHGFEKEVKSQGEAERLERWNKSPYLATFVHIF